MKNNLREFAKNKRKELDLLKSSKKIYENLIQLKEYESAKNIYCYYSFKDEIDTHEMLKDKTKNWYIPKIEGENLLVCPYNDNCLKENKYKIPEPQSNGIKDLTIIDMIIIPALAADKNGYRIGYGKGYYDRFLKTLKHNPVKVVLTYSDLLFDNIFPDEFDEKCNIIITDKEIYRINC